MGNPFGPAPPNGFFSTPNGQTLGPLVEIALAPGSTETRRIINFAPRRDASTDANLTEEELEQQVVVPSGSTLFEEESIGVVYSNQFSGDNLVTETRMPNRRLVEPFFQVAIASWSAAQQHGPAGHIDHWSKGYDFVVRSVGQRMSSPEYVFSETANASLLKAFIVAMETITRNAVKYKYLSMLSEETQTPRQYMEIGMRMCATLVAGMEHLSQKHTPRFVIDDEQREQLTSEVLMLVEVAQRFSTTIYEDKRPQEQAGSDRTLFALLPHCGPSKGMKKVESEANAEARVVPMSSAQMINTFHIPQLYGVPLVVQGIALRDFRKNDEVRFYRESVIRSLEALQMPPSQVHNVEYREVFATKYGPLDTDRFVAANPAMRQ